MKNGGPIKEGFVVLSIELHEERLPLFNQLHSTVSYLFFLSRCMAQTTGREEMQGDEKKPHKPLFVPPRSFLGKSQRRS